jgi:hypothetical protein
VPGCIEDAQVDLCPRVLVAADDHAGPVHVEEQDGAIRWRLSQNVVLNGQVQVRVVARGDVALQLVSWVGQCVREGREAPRPAKTTVGYARACEQPCSRAHNAETPGWCHCRVCNVPMLVS